MTKESWVAAHDELIAEYLDEHPDATEVEAVDKTADFAHDRMIDNISALAGRHKEGLGK